jgi:putative peptidoglycan lipid II flippase
VNGVSDGVLEEELAKSHNTATAPEASHRRIFLQSAGIVAASVFLSRILGFFREWAIAHQVGANGLTDIYYAAFTIPDILNYLLAGAALSITFIPIFLEYFSTGREEESWRVFSIVLTALTSLLVILLLIAELFASQLTHWIAPGFDPTKHQALTHLTRIMLPAQAFFVMGGVLSAVQYAEGRFVIPSLAPLVYNGLIIGFGILLGRYRGIEGFAWGVLAGAFLGNFLIQVYGAAKLGARYSFVLDLRHPGFRRFMRLSIPIMLGFSVIFIDDWAIRWRGSYLPDASITWLNYGKSLMRVVVAIFAQSAGVASYPLLARSVAEGKVDEMKDRLQDALQHVVLAMLPISILMGVLSRQVVYILFSHTRLTTYDIQQTAIDLMIFLTGAIAWGVQQIVARGFYALGDTITPTVIGSGLTLAWLPVYWELGNVFQHKGLAAASSLGVTVYTAVLCIVLYRRLQMPLGSLGSLLLKTLACSAIAGLLGIFLERHLEVVITWHRLVGSLVQGGAVTIVFVLAFVGCGMFMGVASLSQIRAALVGKRAG